MVESVLYRTAVAAVACLLCLLTVAEGTRVETFNEVYGPFNEDHYGLFAVETPATITGGVLQVTPDSASADFNLFNNSGRVLLNRRFRLWEAGRNPRVASFNTSFLLNIYRPGNDTPGEGLAFVIVPDTALPSNSSGAYLGLTNSSTDGDSINRLIAVELDTFRQDFDPDDNHIGIDINGVRSVAAVSLYRYNITLAPMGTRLHVVWVDYDGDRRFMEVYIAQQPDRSSPIVPKPNSPVLNATMNLSDFINQDSYFGFSASTGNTMQLNCVLLWNLTVNHFVEEESRLLEIVLGVSLPLLVLLLITASALLYRRHRKRKRDRLRWFLVDLKFLPGMPREFEFKDLNKATDGFAEKNKLGQGGYGAVYKGLLETENVEIAVKLFSRESIKGRDDFLAELKIIHLLRHKNLVRLLGWCHQNNKLILVYEYMPNGSLDKHLFSGTNGNLLGWDLRCQIITNVAAALHYLHEEYDQRVVHRDLKASNIMLDSKFNARLGDFGLARALETSKPRDVELDGVPGTMGYIAPECFHTGKATQQSDVYAFGVVVLEVISGQRPGMKIGGFDFLVDWVWYLHKDGILLQAVDGRLESKCVEEEARKMLLLGLACCHPDAKARPKTKDIVQIILGVAPTPHVPHFRPAFIWPSAKQPESC